YLETALLDDIKKEIETEMFIPYIQLHEFEGLLFSDVEKFSEINVSDESLARLRKIANEFQNPELIDDGATTSPSKRISYIVKKYHKVDFGSLIADKIGIETMRTKCSHFSSWIDKLIEITKK
ncbi:MAG: DUF4276 family protein, partial [Candidatus Cloacimonetes bacterium]|nr:DUF4276 family protein [Candidatus Cloacimonadota bacterium]